MAGVGIKPIFLTAILFLVSLSPVLSSLDAEKYEHLEEFQVSFSDENQVLDNWQPFVEFSDKTYGTVHAYSNSGNHVAIGSDTGPRETPAEPLAQTLMSKGIEVGAWDPHIESTDYPEEVTVIEDINDAQDYDIAVLVTAHKACVDLDWKSLLENMRTPLLYDGRRVLNLSELGTMGWQTHAVGRPV